jgi:hypothetical protein
MRGGITALVAILFISWLSPLAATTYLVLPDGTGDFPTIQAAIDAATDGDVIELGDGTFRGAGNHPLQLTEDLIIRSTSGDPDRCIIDCEGSASAHSLGLAVWPSAPSTAMIQGLSVVHGYGESHGGVWCGASVSFVDCVFADNTIEYSYGGGGVYCQGCAPTFIGCRFERNRSVNYGGGGILVYYGGPVRFDGCVFAQNAAGLGAGGCGVVQGSAEFSDCLFLGNMAQSGGAAGAGDGGSMTMDRCTVVGNSAGGLCAWSDALLAATNTIVAWNTGGVGICCSASSSVNLTCCDIFGNEGGDWVGCIADYAGIDGNICLDPLLCDWQGGDLHLQLGSLCAPEYNPACGLIGALPVGCGQTPVGTTTWGRIKAAFLK